MEDKKITAAHLLRETGLNKSLITQWKNGLQKPSTDAIIKIAEYFGVSTDYLLKGEYKTDDGIRPFIPPSVEEALVGFSRREGDFTDDELAQIDTFFQVLEARRKQKKGV